MTIHIRHYCPLLTTFHVTSHIRSTSTSTSTTTTPPLPMDQAAEQQDNHTPSASSKGSSNMGSGQMGKHRMSAAISFLNQQIQVIQDELDELETIGGVSTVCPDLMESVDSVPDALLPMSKGPPEISWDRWFQGAQSSRSRRRWI